MRVPRNHETTGVVSGDQEVEGLGRAVREAAIPAAATAGGRRQILTDDLTGREDDCVSRDLSGKCSRGSRFYFEKVRRCRWKTAGSHFSFEKSDMKQERRTERETVQM